VSGDQRFLIIAGFQSTERKVTVTIPDDVATRAGLTSGAKRTVKDVLWNQAEVEFDGRTLTCTLGAFGAYIYQLH
jgi:hypothetical protein